SNERKNEFFTPAFLYVAAPNFGITANQENTTSNESTPKALFGQDSYDLSELLLEGLKVTAGYRKTWDTRELWKNDYLFTAFGNSCRIVGLPGNTPQADCNQHLQDDFGDDNYNLTIEYAITPDVFTYLASRKGYKSGGFNTSTNNPDFIRYDSELVTDYEFGLKTNWLLADIPVRFNVAVFQADYTDIQTSAIVNSGGSLGTVIVNRNPVTGESTEATFTGNEIELAIAPTTWWELSGFYSHLSPKWDTATTTAGRDLSGELIDKRIPETAGLTSRMTTAAPAGLGGEMSLNLIYSYSAESIQTPESNTRQVRAEQIDARVDWTNIGGTNVDVG